MPLSVSSPPLVDAAGQLHRPAEGPVRIVSLVPSLTELLCDLGLIGQLVGRTGFCVHPREALHKIPKVGGTKDVKSDVVRALAPTHLIVNIDENRRETVEELAASVPAVVVTHPCSPQDNLALYELFGGLFGCPGEAMRLQAGLRQALDEARILRDELPDEEVLYLVWRAPWMTVARETYISACLAEVGWRTVPVSAVERYPPVDWDAPEVRRVAGVLLPSEPYRFTTRHVGEVEALAGRPARLIDGEMCSWYGSRAVAGMRYLTALRRRLAAAGFNSPGA